MTEQYLSDLLERSSVHLIDDQTEALENLLIKYKGVFSQSSDDIRRTNLPEHNKYWYSFPHSTAR